jgi:crotonobetaine/carnitine-CoA ligase
MSGHVADPERPPSLPGMLASSLREHPDRVFLRTTTGELTYAGFASEVDRAWRRLAGAGVGPGDAVGLMMGTGLDQVAAWFALTCHGVLHVPVNPALMGDQLAHVLDTAQVSTLVADASCLDRLRAVAPRVPGLKRVVVHRGEPSAVPSPFEVSRWAGPGSGEGPATPIADVADDLAVATLLFTSGSTGRSKACALSHRYMASQGRLHVKYLGIRPDDVLYTPFPLFHIDGANLTVSAALAAGCTAALGERFSASNFWTEVRELGATVFNFMGATLTILLRRPPSPDDRRHRVRFAWGVPMPEWYREWEPRFGFPLVEVYGSTDAGVPVYDPLGEPHREGSCGRVIDEYEVITVDGHGVRNDPGGVGEIWVRGRVPGLVMSGYHRMPDATAETLHPDGWVRTGDLGSLSADGRLSFRSRLSDTVRRRGENISAHEVERLVETHPDVAGCAAVGVPSELTEEDVKIFVEPRQGVAPTPEALVAFCRTVMPPYMVPRYVQLVDALPRTPTEKVDKPALRGIGDPARTHDAEADRPARTDGAPR